jgi:hypothetical protein
MRCDVICREVSRDEVKSSDAAKKSRRSSKVKFMGCLCRRVSCWISGFDGVMVESYGVFSVS